jgi:hypothetical protein
VSIPSAIFVSNAQAAVKKHKKLQKLHWFEPVLEGN